MSASGDPASPRSTTPRTNTTARPYVGSGVCADISGAFLSADGEPVKTDLTDRMIGIDAEQMRAIPEVIVIAFGMAKVPAIVRRSVAGSSTVSSRTPPWRKHCST